MAIGAALIRSDVRGYKRYWHYSLLATVATMGIPLLVAMELANRTSFSPLLLTVASITVAAVVSVLGNALWMRQPGCQDLSFGELMLWTWARRCMTEKRFETAKATIEDQIIAARLGPIEQLHVLRELSGALDHKDPYTFGHSRRVERFAYRTGLALGLPLRELDDLRKAASIHDVGKIEVPDEILRKEGALTADEYDAIKEHSAAGAAMVDRLGKPTITEAVLHHHERFDGQGYPHGRSGQEIPLLARIIGVVDAYDAMTSTRSYRASLGHRRAIEILGEEMGCQFDPEVVSAFLTTQKKPVMFLTALPFLASPSRFIRTILEWFARNAHGSVATAVGAVGAAIAFSSSFIGIAPDLSDPSKRVPVAQASSARVAGERTKAIRVGADAQFEPSAGERRQTARAEAEKRRERQDRLERRRARRADGDGSKAVVAAPNQDSTGGTGSGKKPDGATSQTADAPVEDDATSSTSNADSDPKPGKGQDCSASKNETNGSTTHCN